MFSRRTFLAASLALGCATVRARGESIDGMKVVGIVYPEPPSDSHDRGWAAFATEMRERGWVEGRNIAFERRYFYGDRTRLPALMAELIALGADVLFVQSVFAVVAAKLATSRIHIVFAVGDAVGRGVVADVARPEANATGVSNRFVETNAKRIELLTQVAPGIFRVAALMNTAFGYPPALFQHGPRGVEVHIVDVRSPKDIGMAMSTVARLGADGISVVQQFRPPYKSQMVEAVGKLRLPAVFDERGDVELGGLLSLGNDVSYNFRRIAVFIDKILRGARPSDLPVEQPAVYELAINLKTAKALGITIPRELLVRADWIAE